MFDTLIKKILSTRVYDVAIETPVHQAPFLSKRLGRPVLLKREDLQPVYSFKCRGAYNKMVGIPKDVLAKGVIAASAGNHAQGVALGAQKLKIPAVIVMPTTTPEIKVRSVRALFPLDQSSDVGEDVRLKNRTLDLRRPEMQNNLRLKSKLTKAIRDYLESEYYMDIETPILTKATPEGARDYLVPSRTSPGNFFALPQSPQLFKQMLMVSGFDKYYQIARCFRDEDLRADRQPEFSQVDIEASFVDEADVMNMAESMIRFSFDKVLNINLGDIPKITWHESMNLYGCDKPDLRNPLILNEVSEVFLSEEFKVFAEPSNDKNSRIAALVIDNGEEIGRGQIDRYTDFVK